MSQENSYSEYYDDAPLLLLIWIRSYWFIAVSLIILVLFSLFILPDKGVPDGNNKILVFIFAGLSFFWLLNTLTDKNKEEWLKSAAVLLFVLTSGWLFFMYAGANWQLLNQQFFNFASMRDYWHVLLQALGVTFKLALTTFIISPIVGAVLAIFRSF